jgi:hypothetical protein
MSDRNGPGGPIPWVTERLLEGRIEGDVTAPEYKGTAKISK